MAMLDHEPDITKSSAGTATVRPNKSAEALVSVRGGDVFRGCYVQPPPSFKPARDLCPGGRLS
jgi:hypothetical protein